MPPSSEPLESGDEALLPKECLDSPPARRLRPARLRPVAKRSATWEAALEQLLPAPEERTS
jgi:hypothetical protein